MADLEVQLYGIRLGTLTGDWRDFDLVTSREAVESFGIDSQMLSLAVPLAVVPTRARKRRRQNFFHELLPEGRMLSFMAQESGLAENDSIGLLRRYGRDVAGALQIWDPAVPGEPKQPRLAPLHEDDVANLLLNLQSYPLGNKPQSGKSSLAGVQDKIVLVRDAEGWHQALDGYPSTHILKPRSSEYPTVIFDEEYGMRVTRAVGLADFDTWIHEFAGVPALVIERYDRAPDAPGGRIHQEDFNQVLGARGIEKYQKFGGKVTLSSIADVMKQSVAAQALQDFFRMVVLSVATGNLDMHAKNISLLHYPDGKVALAPTYDVVPQVHQSNDGELAMAISGEYRHAAITRSHLLAEAGSWGLAGAGQILDEILDLTLQAVESEQPHPLAYPRLAVDITRFVRNLMDGRPAGATA